VILALEAFFVDVLRQGKRCLLIVDEAQNLTHQAVEELRMLSNFQFETRGLLQSFLIGQPEFRAILQSPHMQQLRQRVLAACHIGPMEQEETRGYIEHRLKCAGYKGRTLFDGEAYAALFKTSGGVPRRINLLCDRILLSGFLGGKTKFKAVDVENLARDINEETMSPGVTPQIPPEAAVQQAQAPQDAKSTDNGFMDLNLAQLKMDSQAANEALKTIGELKKDLSEQHIVRLEQSMMQIERSTAATLSLLQQMVKAIRVTKKVQTEKPG
jgi:hypothetical protein